MNNNDNWSILTSYQGIKLLSKNIGELRFGPTYINVKNEPNNVFGNNFFGDWFYKTNKGVFLQKWNSDPIKDGVKMKVNNDLIFFDFSKNEIKIIEKEIKSFFWEIEKNENNELIFYSDNGKRKKMMKINHIT